MARTAKDRNTAHAKASATVINALVCHLGKYTMSKADCYRLIRKFPTPARDWKITWRSLLCMLNFAKACLKETKPDDESNSESEAHSDSESEAPSDSEDGDYVGPCLKKPATKIKPWIKVKTEPEIKAATKPTFKKPSARPREMKSNKNLQRNLEDEFNTALPCTLKVNGVMRTVSKIGDHNAKENNWILASLTECNGMYKAEWIQKNTNKAGISTYQRSESWCYLEDIKFC